MKISDSSDIHAAQAEIDRLIQTGDVLPAYNLAVRLLEVHPDAPELKYRAVLSLARAGASGQALSEYKRLGLAQISDNEDVGALYGRLLKDLGSLQKFGDGQEYFLEAARQYARVFAQTGGYFSGINAASLYFISGRDEKSRELIEKIWPSIALADGDRSPGDYFRMATKAEALLLKGELASAREVLASAINRFPGVFAAHATTLKQFQLLLEYMGAPVDWLEILRPPKIVHYAGHIFGADGQSRRLGEKTAAKLSADIRAIFDDERVGFAYGALAAGSDILFAEILLDMGVELHVVLPSKINLFVQSSVSPYGSDWVGRFDACLSQASSINIVSDRLSELDDEDFAMASMVAMGRARLHAEQLESRAMQVLAVEDGGDRSSSLTGRDHDLWQATKCQQSVIVVEWDFSENRASTKPETTRSTKKMREQYAMLFADFAGYGLLSTSEINNFVAEVLDPLARLCIDMMPAADYRNTWGDGIFLAYSDIAVAAEVALRLQEVFISINLKKVGLPEGLSLRVGGHFGPATKGFDPIMREENIFGPEVIAAANIEPITIPGSVFVSETFACAVTLLTDDHFRCEYVGKIARQKDGGSVPLFNLLRR